MKKSLWREGGGHVSLAEPLFWSSAFQGLIEECLLSLAKKGRWFLACTHTHFGLSIRIKYHIFTREYMFLSLGHKSLIKFLKVLFPKKSYSSASARKKCDGVSRTQNGG